MFHSTMKNSVGGDRYLIQAQQFVNSHIYYTKDLADRCGFHAFIIRIRGYAPSSMVTEDLGRRLV